MKTKNLPSLRIHELSQEQFERAYKEGRINEGEIYLTPEEEITPEKIGARPDTWMPTAADVGAAPAGYGLGTAPRTFKFSEVDSLRTTGWYFLSEMGSQLGGVYVNFAFCRVMATGGNFIQEVFPVQTLTKIMRLGYNASDGTLRWGDWSAKDWSKIVTSENFSYSNGTLTITTD